VVPHFADSVRHDDLPAKKNSLQLAGAAERGYGEKNEEKRHEQGDSDEPVGYIAGPGSKGVIEPTHGEDSEGRAGDFVEKLLGHAPKPAETAEFRRLTGWWCGHGAMLAEGC
jgi:hypothetical protein